jgi:quercetin dioxygenase-like cupin family protein
MKVVRSSDVTKDQVNVEGAKGVEIRVLIGKQDGAKNFVMRMFEVQPAGHTPLHEHRHEHEVFVVEGQGMVVCEGQEQGIEKGFAVFVPGGEKHCFKNTGKSVMRFLCLVPADAG